MSELYSNALIKSFLVRSVQQCFDHKPTWGARCAAAGVCVSARVVRQGYTIPLDKRLAADGRGLQETAINDNFAKFTEALYVAEQSARRVRAVTPV